MTTFRRALLRLLLLLVASIGLSGLLAACGGSGTAADDVEVHTFRYERMPNGNRYFSGTLVNKRSRRIPIAEIEVALYGADGSRVGTDQIQVEDIPAQDSLQFRSAANIDESIARVRVRSVLVP
jgi:hypothetical protein